MTALFNRQEAPEDVNAAMLLIMQTDDRLRALPTDLVVVRPGSVLDMESRHTAYEPTASRVQALRNVALDNLQLVFRDVLGTDEQRALDPENQAVSAYPFSSYPPIRAAVEAAATALWVIQPATKALRVIRTLQLSYRDAVDRGNLAAALGASADRRQVEDARTARTVARLNELKDSVPTLRQKELGNPPKYTAILKAASRPWTARYEGMNSITPFLIWKISSAYIHGSTYVLRDFSDVRQLEEFVDGHAQFELTPKMALLAVSLLTAVQLLERLDQRFAELATLNHAHREVAEVVATRQESDT